MVQKSKIQAWMVAAGVVSITAGFVACAQSPESLEPERWGVRIIEQYPHDTNAYTQGLTIDDGLLYEGTGRLGSSSIRRVDLQTGEVEQINRLNRELFGEGIAVVGDRIYQLTWQNGLALVFDKHDFRILETFIYRGEGWGLTYDGRHLIMSDGTATIRFLDPDTFEQVRSVDVHTADESIDDINELEFIDDEIWANIWYEDTIVRISPADGRVLGWIDISEVYPSELRDRDEVANGIAHDAATGKLYITGKLWPRLYEIEITGR